MAGINEAATESTGIIVCLKMTWSIIVDGLCCIGRRIWGRGRGLVDRRVIGPWRGRFGRRGVVGEYTGHDG